MSKPISLKPGSLGMRELVEKKRAELAQATAENLTKAIWDGVVPSPWYRRLWYRIKYTIRPPKPIKNEWAEYSVSVGFDYASPEEAARAMKSAEAAMLGYLNMQRVNAGLEPLSAEEYNARIAKDNALWETK